VIPIAPVAQLDRATDF